VFIAQKTAMTGAFENLVLFLVYFSSNFFQIQQSGSHVDSLKSQNKQILTHKFFYFYNINKRSERKWQKIHDDKKVN